MGHGHLDPGWYDYPSLLMALLAPVQAFFAKPDLEAARYVAVAIGLGGVAATWWLGRRAYGTGAAIVGAATVAVATTHVAYSRMAVTDVLLTLATTCVLALAVERRLEWAGLAVGLAASAKYPGAIAIVPVVVAGWGRWRALAAAGLLAVLGFALTSPFVLIHGGRAWDDIERVQRLARERLARVRGRPGDAVRVRRAAVECGRAVPARRARRPRRCAACGDDAPTSSSSRSSSPTGSR